jgi:hypothetical protein
MTAQGLVAICVFAAWLGKRLVVGPRRGVVGFVVACIAIPGLGIYGYLPLQWASPIWLVGIMGVGVLAFVILLISEHAEVIAERRRWAKEAAAARESKSH